MYYHVWFSTKGRTPALVDEIGEAAKYLLRETAAKHSIGLLTLDVATDHVHLLLNLSGDESLASVMHLLKGASAREIFVRYPELRFDMAGNSFWQKGYGSRIVPSGQVETVRRYIETQDDRSLRHS